MRHGALATRSKMPLSSLARIVLIPQGTVIDIPMVYSDWSIFTTGWRSNFIAGFLGPNQRPQRIVFSFLKRMRTPREVASGASCPLLGSSGRGPLQNGGAWYSGAGEDDVHYRYVETRRCVEAKIIQTNTATMVWVGPLRYSNAYYCMW